MSHDPYAAPTSNLEAVTPPDAFLPGGRWERLGAVLVDAVLSSLLTAAIAFAVGDFAKLYALVLHGGRPDLAWKARLGLANFAMYCALNAYPLAIWGQSWGKRMLGIKIVDMQGRKPGVLRLLFLRYGLVRLVGLAPVVGGLLALIDDCFIFRADRRCLHDILAGTRVVVAAHRAGIDG
jgi:uncharacterized RDD family membrane protein YckC